MKLAVAACAAACVIGTAAGESAAAALNPLQKVIQLMTELQGKVIADGEAEQKSYNDFSRWCGQTSGEKQAEIREGAAQKEDLSAKIEKAQSDAEEANAQIQALSGSIASNEADLKAITLLRKKERDDFEELDRELTGSIDTLQKARRVLETEMSKQAAKKTKAAFLQRPTRGMQLFTAAITELVSAARTFSREDRQKLTVLLNTGVEDSSGDAEDSLGAPSAEAYESHSGGILGTLEGLQKKTEDAQTETRKDERNRRQNFESLRQSLQDKLEAEGKDLDDTKSILARAGEIGAQAQKALDMCIKDLKDDNTVLEKLQHDCMARATEFAEEVRTRKAELEALASAKKAIQDTSAGSFAQQAYSLVQLRAERGARRPSGAAGQAAGAAARQLRRLAKATGSLALEQLAAKADAAARGGDSSQAHSADPFEKVRGLVKSMIGKLEGEASDASEQKEFCDREMTATTKAKEDKEDEVGDLTSRMETAASEVAKLREELKTLSSEITEVAKSQNEADRIRREEHDAYVKAKKDLEDGLTGVQRALAILRDYYGGDSSAAALVQTDVTASMAEASAGVQAEPGSGAGKTIVGLLEVVQSDFAESLTEVQTAEQTSADAHEKLTQENKVTTASRQAEVKHKTAEVTQLKKLLSEQASDRSQAQQELEAIDLYLEKLKPQCLQEPESFEDRMDRRREEMKGLKAALETLESGES